MDIAKVERVYTNYSGVYDHIFGKIFHESRESAVRNLRIRPNEQILEVGVGTGIALAFYPKNCEVTGIDLSPACSPRQGTDSRDTTWITYGSCSWMPAIWNLRMIPLTR